MTNLKDVFYEYCLQALKRKDVKEAIKNIIKPVLALVIQDIYPYIYISVIFIFITFLLILGIFIFLLRIKIIRSN
jgi:hypothetical protein